MAATIMTRVIIIIIYHIKYHYNHICIISNIINDDESHHKVNRTEFLSELEGGRVILQGDDPHVQWQWDHRGNTWWWYAAKMTTMVMMVKMMVTSASREIVNLKSVKHGKLRQVEITDSSCHGLICQDTAYKFKFQQRALTWKHLQLLLLDIPETTRQRTNCWLNIGTSALARKIRRARQSWARQIRMPTKSENAMNVGHVAAGTTMLFTRLGL